MFKYLEKNKKLLVYTPLIVYWLILFTATTVSVTSMPSIGIGDKLNHLFAYFILYDLLFLALLFQEKFVLTKYRVAFYSLLICALYGIFDEVHQMFIPGRSAEFLDWLADVSGASIGVIFMLYVVKKFKYNLKTAN